MGMLNVKPARRTAHQIVNAQGKPYLSAVTSNLWVSDAGRFADSTDGNQATYFVTGQKYFADLLAEIDKAEHQILIAGWQVSWDALLAPGIRLYDALYKAASKKPALKIYVMPWDDHEPVQTYDDQTVAALELINKKLGRTQLYAKVSPTYAATNSSYYSHHQKQVVIDGKIAYVGGMDLCYGRYCDEHYTLQADADGRNGLNRYNGCVVPVGTMDSTTLADPDLLSGAIDSTPPSVWSALSGMPTPAMANVPSNAERVARLIHAGGLQPRYADNGVVDTKLNSASLASNKVDPSTLDATRQPRMPWQDVHCRIEGPAVADLMRNFVNRWNIIAPKAAKLPPAPGAKSLPKAGNMSVQVLRSAPLPHCEAEYKALANNVNVKSPTDTQHDIYSAMMRLIEKSRRFIYIENQFFVSDFGAEVRPKDRTPAAEFINQYDGKNQNRDATVVAHLDSKAHHHLRIRQDDALTDVLKPPQNKIVAKLLKRIEDSALSGSSWHAYITLPVHPEGTLATANIVTQVHMTMQTLVFGRNSLLNGIRRIIKARELLHAKEADFRRALAPDNNEYEDVDMERCEEFVTLLNLRNWAQLGSRYVTEQIYVHSKVMIVDDLYALIGSANINDRSLLGDRDSELAVLIADNNTLRADVNGKGSQREVRRFAHELRKDLWKKIFGFAHGKAPANELEQAIDQPGLPDSWKLIQQRARQNAQAYEAAFNWVPRNKFSSSNARSPEASILPTWDNKADAPEHSKWGSKGVLSHPMPFQPEFWSQARHTSDGVAQLTQIKGFITALPIKWTKGEDNRFDYPTDLVADNGQQPQETREIDSAQSALAEAETTSKTDANT